MDSTLLLRVKTQSSMQLPLSIFSSKMLMEELEQNNFLVGLYYGIFFIVLLYNIVLFIIHEIEIILRYIFFLSLLFSGNSHLMEWELNTYGVITVVDRSWIEFFIALTAFSALYFSRHFLHTSLYTPKIDKVDSSLSWYSVSLWRLLHCYYLRECD